MSTLASRRRRSVDFWPGFVDALSSLLMVLVFAARIVVEFFKNSTSHIQQK